MDMSGKLGFLAKVSTQADVTGPAAGPLIESPGQGSLARAAVLVRSRHLTRGRGTPLRSLIHRPADASPEGWQREPVQYDKSIRV